MNFIKTTQKNAQFINKATQAIEDAISAVRSVYTTFPEPIQKKYHNLYDCILTGLNEDRNDYVALGSCLLSNATLRILTTKKEEKK